MSIKNSPRVDQEREIHNHLKNADIILIFLSPDYMDADFLANRLKKAFIQSALLRVSRIFISFW